MSIIAIITARGGSKRIPKKNIKDFCGKPIIAYTIAAALESGIFDEVMVSTDSEEIAEIAKKYGAHVPFMRSEATSTDTANTQDVINEVLFRYEQMGKTFDCYCCLYPTAPFVTGFRLNDAYKMFERQNASVLLPVTEFSFPPLRGLKVNDMGEYEIQYPQYYGCRSQDLEKVYHDCGQFYFYSNELYDENGNKVDGKSDEVYMKTKEFYDKNGNRKKTVAYPMPEIEVQDIDNQSDWDIAEVKYRILKEKGII